MILFFVTAIFLVILAWPLAMATVTDTVSRPINGKDGTADFIIDDGTDQKHYKCILDMFRVREIIEMTTADTFCTEGAADQEPGRSQLQFEIGGLLKKGGVLSGPLIPAPQNVDVTLQYSLNCTIDLTANFTEATADRLANQNARLGARGISKGTYLVSWDDDSLET